MDTFGKESNEYLFLIRKVDATVPLVVPAEIPPSPETGVNADGYQISQLGQYRKNSIHELWT